MNELRLIIRFERSAQINVVRNSKINISRIVRQNIKNNLFKKNSMNDKISLKKNLKNVKNHDSCRFTLDKFFLFYEHQFYILKVV